MNNNNKSKHYTKKATSYKKKLAEIEETVEKRLSLLGIEIDERFAERLKTRVNQLRTKIEKTQKEFKKEALDLVTDDIFNKQNIVEQSGVLRTRNVVSMPRISEMDSKISFLKGLKKKSETSLKEQIENLYSQIPVNEKNNKGKPIKLNKDTFLGRRNLIKQEIDDLKVMVEKNNTNISQKERKKYLERINSIEEKIKKLKEDFQKEFRRLYKIIVVNKSSKIANAYKSFIRPHVKSKLKLGFNRENININFNKLLRVEKRYIDTWDTIIAAMRRNAGEKSRKVKYPNKSNLLLKKSYQTIVIIGDGSCQFRALAQGIVESGKNINFGGNSNNRQLAGATRLRQIAHEIIDSNNKRYNKTFRNFFRNSIMKPDKPDKPKARRTAASSKKRKTAGGVPNEPNIPNDPRNDRNYLNSLNQYLMRLTSPENNEWGDDITLPIIAQWIFEQYSLGTVVLVDGNPSNKERYSGMIIYPGPGMKKENIYLKYTPTRGKEHYDLLLPVGNNNTTKLHSNISAEGKKVK